jgi:hypothetical protein
MAETGLSLVVTKEMLEKLQRADHLITNLATKSEQAEKRIIASFKRMGDDGVGAFIRRLNEAQNKLSSFGNVKIGSANFDTFNKSVTNAIDIVNKLTTATTKIPKENIVHLQLDDKKGGVSFEETLNRYRQRIDQLKKEMDIFKSWESGNLLNTKDYAYIGKVADEVNRLIAAYDALYKAQQSLNKSNFNSYIQDLGGNSFDDKRSKEILAKMREYYLEEEKRIQANAKQQAKAESEKRKELARTAKEAERIAKQQAKAEELRIRNESRMRREDYKRYISTQDTYDHAMKVSGRATTINQSIRAIQALEQARKNLRRTDEDYIKKLNNLNVAISHHKKLIDNATKGVDNLRNKHRGLLNITEQLSRRIALVFSVSQITGYVQKLIQVRGEFELQQRSLQALLQNKDEANKLWQQTIDLAVRSPFRVKELVTYTKQLAAYRIESDKLYETNKMLADVSAGLGVDMQRLILAYGQVKAANYLRGTELRQFSEAGVNILGELSEYFSELEGRAISVGDVFEMVSKRMVSFSDVEEVFKRLTSEGGTFYRMQEIQSETLRGMVSNLKDSIDLMMNEIGSNNEGVIKSMVSTVKTLVENWREVAFALKEVIIVMTAWKGINHLVTLGMKEAKTTQIWYNKLVKKKIAVTLKDVQTMTLAEAKMMGLNRMQFTLAKGSMYLQSALKGVTSILRNAFPFLIIAGIVLLIRRITEASRAAKELKKNLNSIFNEDTTNLYKQIDAYKDLVTRLEQANKGSKERNDIIGKLNSQYGEYLNFVVDEQTSIQNLSDAYEDVVERMKEKQALATFEKGMDAIAKSYSDSLQDAKDEFYDLFKGQSIINTKSSFSGIVPTKKEVDDIYAIVQQRVRELNADQIDNLSEQSKLIQEIIKDYYGEDFALSRDYGKSIELLDILVDKKEKERELQKDINAQYGETLRSREANLALEKLQNEYAEKRRNIEKSGVSKFDINKQLNELAKLEKLDIIDLKVRFNIITPESGAIEKDKIINWVTNVTKSVNETIQKELGNIFSEEDLAKVLINEDMQKSQSISEYVKGISSAWEQQNEIIAEQISLKSEGLTINEDLLDNAFRMEKLYRKVAKLLGIELKYEERINEETRKSINDKLPLEYQISLEESLKSQASLLEEANKKKEDAIKLQAMYNASQKQGVSISEEQLKKVDEEVKYWTLRWELLGGTKKQEGNDRSNSLYDERIKVIDDMNKKYKELNKTLSKSESLQGAFDAYIDAFASAFEGISWVPKNVKSMTPQEFASQVLNFPNENDLVRFLDELSKEPMKAFEKIKVELAKGEYVYDMKVRAKIEEDENLLDQIEEMFSGYELSLELQKLNIPPDLAKGLFDVDTITLPELKTNILELKPQFKGQDMLKEWDRIVQQLDQLEAKQQEENAKRFVKFLSKSLDETKVILEQKGVDVAFAKKLFDEGKINAQQFGEVVKNITTQVNSDISKINLDKFKESPEYIQTMGNMYAYSAQEVRKLIDSLQEVVAANSHLFSADEAEAYQKAIQNAQEALDDKERSFFRWEDFAKVGEILKTEKELEKAKKDRIALQEQEKKQQEELVALQKKLQQLELSRAILKTKGLDTTNIDTQIGSTQDAIGVAQQLVLSTQNNAKTTSLVIDKLGAKMQGLVGKTGSAVAIIDAIIHGINDTVQGVNEIYGEIGSVMESFGKETDFSTTFGKGAMIMDTFAKSSQAATQGWEALKQGDIAGVVVNVVKSVTEIIKGINAFKDAKLEVGIQDKIEEVEKLEKAYNDLAKSIEKAYSISSFEKANDAAMKNLRDRIDATEKMIQLEDDKKATDKERIDEWKDEVKSMRDTLRELEEDRIESLGGFGSGDAYKSASEEFVSAWLDAYKEAGDGLSGLNDQFDTFFEDMLTKQLMMRGVDKFLQPFYEQFDDMFKESGLGGGLATKEELDNIKNMWANVSPQLNNFLSGLMDSLGVAQDLSSGELSGLQRGIQGITEDQADILASYLNSIRFFVADNNTKLSTFIDSFTSSETPNPILSELRSQSDILRTIRDMFSSVIGSGNSTTHIGSYIKVAM